jgi:hypothetical protein
MPVSAAILISVRGRGKTWFSGLAAFAVCLLAVAPAAALADDANGVPPHLELTASGTQEDPVGPHAGSLAYYSTDETDWTWGYAADSSVSFSCLVDGQPAPCSRSYYQPCCPVARQFAVRVACPRRPKSLTGDRTKTARERRKICRPTRQPPAEPHVPEGKVLGVGPYTGWVPIPETLADGPHTITVIASDEDGTDPSPPSVTAVYDTTAPAAPEIVSAPPRVSRNAKPKFRYAAVDERKLFDTYNDPFSASLRRLKPTRGPRLHTGDPFGNYLEWRGPFCKTPFRCTEVSWAAYSASGEGGTTFGIRERLSPGLYEFRVSVQDTVFNESPATTYRFRVLKPKSQSRP